jgi:hypothetical protein
VAPRPTSLVLTAKAPLRVPRRWRAEVVASARGWHLAVTRPGPARGSPPRRHAFDGKACLGILADVKRGWRRIALRRRLGRASPGASLRGIYSSSGPVQVGRDLLGDHVLALGVEPRTRRGAARAGSGATCSSA